MTQSIKDFVYFIRHTKFDRDETVVIITHIIGFVVGVFLLFNTLYVVHQFDSNWVGNASVVKDYETIKSAFNNQKWGIINAYNAQTKNINTNGLKTERDFYGLNFKPDDFKNEIDSFKNQIYTNHEDKEWFSFSDDQKDEISKLFDKLGDRISAKMTKIKAFYDTRIRKMYSALKNRQKVNFANLIESHIDKSVQFSNKDFDTIGSLINRDISRRGDNACVFLLSILLLILSVDTIVFVIKGVRLGKHERLEKSGYYDKLYA